MPASLVQMTMPISTLPDLPDGAAYTEKQGNATASVKRKGDSLIVTASCDSLQQLVYQLEEGLHRARDETEQVKIEERPIQSPFKWYVYGVITGFVVMAILVVIIKKKK